MENNIFKTTLKNQGHYEVRLLPNINDLNGNRLKISFKAGFGHMNWINNHISYALINGDIKVWVYGDVIVRKLRKLHHLKYIKYWDLTNGKYLDINTSEKQGFLKVDIDLCEDDMYNFKDNRIYIEKLYDTIKHIKLEDVLYQELFKRAHIEWGNGQYYTGKRAKMYDVYCDEYDDFEERYTVWLRNKKIKQIVG